MRAATPFVWDIVSLLMDGYVLDEYGYCSASVERWHLALAKLEEIGYTLFGDEFFMAFIWTSCGRLRGANFALPQTARNACASLHPFCGERNEAKYRDYRSVCAG